MPTLKQLKYVIKVVELGSINEAAKQLYISQPSLSNALKLIEEELKITIFKRSSKGVFLTTDGEEFLSYARQIIDQVNLMDTKYKSSSPQKKKLYISSQHYAFVVHAFVDLVKNYAELDYDFTLRETETNNIIEDVNSFRSEIGILFFNDFNKNVLKKVLDEKELIFTALFNATPHVFIAKSNPLANKKTLDIDDLQDFPCLSFEQGKANSFYFSEEILSTRYNKKSIKVSDRATIFNLMIGVDGYTISSGVLSKELNDKNIISIPLNIQDIITIGWIKHKKKNLSIISNEYIISLKRYIKNYGFKII